MFWIFLILPLSCSIVVFLFDKSAKKIYAITTLPSIFILWVTFAAVGSGYFKELQVFNTIKLTVTSILVLITISFSNIIPLLFQKKRIEGNSDYLDVKYMPAKLSNFFLSTFFFMILAITYFSYKRAGGVSSLMLDPRNYELTFGKYTVLNYVYFSSAVIALGFIERHYHKKSFINVFAICVLIACASLFGNKTSFLDLLIICMIYTYLRFSFNFTILLLPLISFILISVYFELVRGGGVIGISYYLTQGSLNFLYFLGEDKFYYIDPVSLIFRFDFLNSYLNDTFPLGFVLNEKYNTATSFFHLWAFGRYLSFFFVYFVYYTCCLNVNIRRPSSVFPVLPLMIAFVLFFFSFRIFMIKLIFLSIFGYFFARTIRRYDDISNKTDEIQPKSAIKI